MIPQLYDYQRDAVGKILGCYRGGFRAPLAVLPTGSGKTVIFSHITRSAQSKGKRVYILVHRQELLRQTSEKLDLFEVHHGCIAPGHSMSGDPVQVASVQTLVRRIDKVPPPDLIVIDEAHHSGASTWEKILKTWSNALLLGVTATPIRLDGKGLGKECGGFYDTLIHGPTLEDLIARNFLSSFTVYAPPTSIDFSGLKMRAGDYEKEEIAKRMDKPTITGCAIEHYQRICPGAPAICFCSSVAHAEHVAEQFNQAGITAASLDGNMDDKLRKSRVASLGNGQIKILTSCDIISEGTDIPVVTTAILLRPTASTGLYLQQVGRVLRVHDKKKNAFIIDHVGNVYRHGFPDDVRSWTLSGQKRTRGAAQSDPSVKIKQCESCFATFRIGIVACPQCGHINANNAREIKQVDGLLTELTRDQVKKKQWQNNKPDHGILGKYIAFAKRNGLPGDWAYRAALRRSAKERFHG